MRTSGTRVRQARVVRNDGRILDAATAVAATDGWAGLTMSAVARGAQMSNRPLQSRFADRSALAAHLWEERLSPALERALADLLASAGTLEGDDAGPAALGSALRALANPEPALLGAVELLTASQFDARLASAVDGTLGRQVAQWCTPSSDRAAGGPITRTTAGQRAFLLSVGIGLVMLARLPDADAADAGAVAPLVIAAIAERHLPVRLPSVRAPFLAASTRFDTGDPALDALLRAALEQVGERGYEGASTSVIAKAAGHSEGLLYARYPSKLALYLDATQRQHSMTVRANEAFMQSLANEHGRGVAEAVMIREMQRPDLAFQRAVTTEQFRVSWHQPELLAAEARTIAEFRDEMRRQDAQWGTILGQATILVGRALGQGALLLAVAWPGCWRAAYDVVTVPLTRHQAPA